MLERFGQIDILVNNAGLVIMKYHSEQTEDDYDAVNAGFYEAVHRRADLIKAHRADRKRIN